MNDRALQAKVRLDQAKGYVEASASAGVNWRGPLAPSIDPSRGVARATATASRFRLSALEPVTQGVVRDLDGTLDANAHFEAIVTIPGSKRIDPYKID